MSPVDSLGWLASALVITSFCLQSVVLLRMVALCGNLTFIVYAQMADATPILVLHSLLLPLNTRRLLQFLSYLPVSKTGHKRTPGPHKIRLNCY